MKILQATLDEMQRKESDQTFLIIAHRLSTIRTCDLICVVGDGRIIESGTHDDLIQRDGIYKRLLLHTIEDLNT